MLLLCSNVFMSLPSDLLLQIVSWYLPCAQDHVPLALTCKHLYARIMRPLDRLQFHAKYYIHHDNTHLSEFAPFVNDDNWVTHRVCRAELKRKRIGHHLNSKCPAICFNNVCDGVKRHKKSQCTEKPIQCPKCKITGPLWLLAPWHALDLSSYGLTCSVCDVLLNNVTTADGSMRAVSDAYLICCGVRCVSCAWKN